MKLISIAFLFLIFGCNNRPKTETNKIEKSSKQVFNKAVTYDTLRFDLEPDIRLFTALAFANISGYDYENTVMTRERLDLRNQLDSILPREYKEKISGTYKSTDGTTFAAVGCKSFDLSLPPNFHWLPDSATLITPKYRKDEKFTALLNEFYLKANIPSLWDRYYANLKKANYEYAPYTDKAIDDIVKFCRINENRFDSIKIHFNICPFMQNESGFTCASTKDIYIIVSPRKTLPGPDAFYHEALHHIVNPMLDKHSTELWKIKNASNIGIQTRQKKGDFYLGLDALAAESLVRTIDYVLRAKHYNWTNEKTIEEINNQYAMGFTLMPFFFEELKKYEKSDLTLDEYFPIMIKNYDLQKEKNRWEKFINSKKY